MSNAVVMLTRKCNMSCRHCSVESHPGITTEPSPEELRRLVMELGEAGVRRLQFTGGEPLIRHRLLFELMELAHTRYGITTAIVSNGFWGKKPERARDFFHQMVKHGLVRLAISYDRFHAKFMGPEPVCNILEVARREQWIVNINITRTADDHELEELLAPFTPYENAAFRFYDVQPVGFAQGLNEDLRGQLEGFCSGCEQPTVCDDGRVAACNGPAYFEPRHSALLLGHLKEGPISELLERHQSDPILETIRLSGPMELKRVLQSTPEFRDFGSQSHYSGMCQLCREICGNPKAVEVLRQKLSEPEQVALRLAQRQVWRVARGESWNRDAVNTTEANRVLFLVVDKDAENHRRAIEQILNRADVDWYRLAKIVSRNGLSSRVKQKRELLAGYAPELFWQLLDEGAEETPKASTLSERLCEWKESDFENLLGLAVHLEERPDLHAQLRQDPTSLGRLAFFMVHSNGLAGQPEAMAPSGDLLTSLRRRLGRAILSGEYIRQNIFVKPLLHLLCPGESMLGSARLSTRTFGRALTKIRSNRSWKETIQLVTNDLLSAYRTGRKVLSNDLHRTQDREDR
ncbi:MAG: radical SAM protein [Vulcanimicrobiota bacterium]